jgi:hypothetical protein
MDYCGSLDGTMNAGSRVISVIFLLCIASLFGYAIYSIIKFIVESIKESIEERRLRKETLDIEQFKKEKKIRHEQTMYNIKQGTLVALKVIAVMAAATLVILIITYVSGKMLCKFNMIPKLQKMHWLL